MKTVIISSVIFILIIVLIVFSTVYTASKSKMVNSLLKQLRDAIEDEDWEISAEIYSDILQKWEKSQKLLAMLFRHEELDNIDESLEKLGSYLTQWDKNKALTEITTLNFHISHLREKDKIQFENLF